MREADLKPNPRRPQDRFKGRKHVRISEFDRRHIERLENGPGQKRATPCFINSFPRRHPGPPSLLQATQDVHGPGEVSANVPLHAIPPAVLPAPLPFAILVWGCCQAFTLPSPFLKWGCFNFTK